jgi:hypothetical protein
MKITILPIIFISLYTFIIFGSENNKCGDIVVIAIPGIRGNATDRGYSENILTLIPSRHKQYKMGTLSLEEKPDLSQTRCLQHLSEKIEPYLQNNILFVSTSQGSGTTTKYIAQNQQLLKNSVKALICEGYTASFNQCLSHAVETTLPFSYYVPFKYYWLPYVVRYLPYFKKTFFPFMHYNPAAQQPFEYLKHLPQELPIIIIHCKQDRITPYEGATIVYYLLRSTGHDNTYFFSVDKTEQTLLQNLDDGHINTLTDEQQRKDLEVIINYALINHTVPYNITKKYQPDRNQFEVNTNNLIAKETWLKKLDTFLKIGKYWLLIYCIWKVENYINTKKRNL